MPDYTLPREERLRSLKTIRNLFDGGHRGFVYPLRYVWAITESVAELGNTGSSAEMGRGSLEENKAGCPAEVSGAGSSAEMGKSGRPIEVMFSVPKKFHKRANRRNLFKRRMREAYRLERQPLCDVLLEGSRHIQIAMIYSTKESHNYKTIHDAVERILEQIRKRL